MSNFTYERLERFGFAKRFLPQREEDSFGARWEPYIGKPFTIVARVQPMENNPMWVIEFADGFRMAANAREGLR